MVPSAKNPDTRRRKLVSPKNLKRVGRKLEDFLINGKLPIAEEKLRNAASLGITCKIDDYEGRRPRFKSSSNTIRAEFLRYLILGGCEKSPVSKRGIGLRGGYIDCCETDGILNLDSAKIDFDIALYDCLVNRTLNFQSAKIKNLFLSGTKLSELLADRILVQGSIYLDGSFEAKREVRLLAGEITGSLNCTGGKFKYSDFNDTDRDALSCDRLVIGGSVFLEDGFISNGSVRLTGTKIGSNLSCSNSTFQAKNNAIIANRAKIDGDVNLGKMKAKGTIAFTGSEIGGDFQPQGAKLEGSPSLQLRNTKIGGTLHWRGFEAHGKVELSGASCKTVNTGEESWCRKREEYQARLKDETETDENQKKTRDYSTELDNFSYEGFSNLPDNCKSEYWIEWLKQQPDEHLGKKFKPRPWEQLAGVLDTMGYEEEARDVRVEKQKLLTSFMIKHEDFGFSFRSLWHWLQIFFRKVLWGPLVAYGYRPGNALVWLFGFVIVGTIIYHQAAQRGIMTPTHPLIYKEARANGTIPGWCAENWVYFPDESCAAAMPSEYSEFQSFVYAADIALPVVNLRMEDDWAPRVVFTDGTRDWFGWSVRLFEWLLIAAGWILSLLFVSAVGSSIRR